MPMPRKYNVDEGAGVFAILCEEAPVYIGSSQGVRGRLVSHFNRLSKGTHACVSLQKLYDSKGAAKFGYVVLEYTSPENASGKELLWAQKYPRAYRHTRVKRILGPLTHAELLDQLSYDPTSGSFTWRVRKPKVKIGSVAGNFVSTTGYRQVTLFGRTYQEHVLAFFYMRGEWPKDDIDHINRIRSDNRWRNLREATRSQNCANTERYGVLRGIAKNTSPRTGRISYKVVIQRKCVGTFPTLEQAVAARDAVVVAQYGEFYATGR